MRGKSSTTRSSSGHFWARESQARELRRDVLELETRRPGREAYDGACVLAEARVGGSDHRDFGDLLELHHRFFDLCGRDVLAAADDDVVQAVGDRHEALVVENAQVAGAVPAGIVERLLGERGIGVAKAQVGAA